MGIMNLLKAKYDGKVGQTVGSKWKNQATLRTYSKPSNPNTEAQQVVRGAFATITSFVALFADQIKYSNALDTSGMSVRNAIIKLNKEKMNGVEFDFNDLIISKGGLQKPNNAALTNAGGTPKFTWSAPTATNFTSEAKAIAVFVDPTDQIVDVVEVKVTELEATAQVEFGTDTDVYGFLYFLDKRGSNKIASLSVASKVTA